MVDKEKIKQLCDIIKKSLQEGYSANIPKPLFKILYTRQPELLEELYMYDYIRFYRGDYRLRPRTARDFILNPRYKANDVCRIYMPQLVDVALKTGVMRIENRKIVLETGEVIEPIGNIGYYTKTDQLAHIYLSHVFTEDVLKEIEEISTYSNEIHLKYRGIPATIRESDDGSTIRIELTSFKYTQGESITTTAILVIPAKNMPLNKEFMEKAYAKHRELTTIAEIIAGDIKKIEDKRVEIKVFFNDKLEIISKHDDITITETRKTRSFEVILNAAKRHGGYVSYNLPVKLLADYLVDPLVFYKEFSIRHIYRRSLSVDVFVPEELLILDSIRDRVVERILRRYNVAVVVPSILKPVKPGENPILDVLIKLKPIEPEDIVFASLLATINKAVDESITMDKESISEAIAYYTTRSGLLHIKDKTLELLRNLDKTIMKLVATGKLRIENGTIYYRGKPLEQLITELGLSRIVASSIRGLIEITYMKPIEELSKKSRTTLQTYIQTV